MAARRESTMAQDPRIFVVDTNEIDRYARAIARIMEREFAPGSAELERAVNTYGTAFQFLVMRRGADYGRALAIAAGDQAMALVDRPDDLAALIAGDLASIHERVCADEEEARDRESDADTNQA
jgi:hypothetical protein